MSAATGPEADTALAVRAETFALTIPRDHQDNDHGNRNHRRYQDHHKNVLENQSWRIFRCCSFNDILGGGG